MGRIRIERAVFAVVLLGAGAIAASSAQDEPDPAPLATLDEALASRHDLWGDAALLRPGGPTYEFFAPLLPPLRYVNTAFREYPLVLSAPAGEHKARLVSDGSSVNARAVTDTWGAVDGPVPIRFAVGEPREPFGSDASRRVGPRFLDGHLPVVSLEYGSGDAVYALEVFAACAPIWARGANELCVKFSLASGAAGIVEAQLETDDRIRASGRQVTDARGRTLIVSDSTWTFVPAAKALRARLVAGQFATLTVISPPPDRLTSTTTPGAATHDSARERCVQEWSRRLAAGADVVTPERVVNDAWRALLIGTWMTARGELLSYSSQNSYQRLFEAECGDALRALVLFGQDGALAFLPALLDYAPTEGVGHGGAFKLQLLSHLYWLTHDAPLIRKSREQWSPEVERLLSERDRATGLLPREAYCGDVGRVVHNLSSSANAWRGLRDFGAVLSEIGDRAGGARLTRSATRLRTAIHDAVQKSVRADVKPPFVPIALFGEESPPDPITATMLGSYWNLMAPYVLGSGALGSAAPETGWIIDYMHEHGGVCMGMMRFHQHSGLFANEDAVDDLYSMRYLDTLLLRDEVDRALVGFYGKLAQGMTRDTFVGAEGTGLRPLDAGGRAMYLPPNVAGNASFLWVLRNLLIQDPDLDDDGRPDALRLLFATPRHWLADGAEIRLGRMPTAFGSLSLTVRSRVAQGEVVVEGVLPPKTPARTLLRLRVPRGFQVTAVRDASDHVLESLGPETFVIGGPGAFRLRATITAD